MSNLEEIKTTKSLLLPRVNYGPLCAKLLVEFIDHHQLAANTAIPKFDDKPHIALSKIFNAMLLTMPKTKRELFIQEAEEYCNSIPPSLRN